MTTIVALLSTHQATRQGQGWGWLVVRVFLGALLLFKCTVVIERAISIETIYEP